MRRRFGGNQQQPVEGEERDGISCDPQMAVMNRVKRASVYTDAPQSDLSLLPEREPAVRVSLYDWRRFGRALQFF